MESLLEKIRGERFADLTMDAGFKAVLADPENIDVLKDIVNAFMPEGRKVETIEFADREISPQIEEGKGVRLDLRCKTTEGQNIIIEMQNQSSEAFFKRCLFYCSKAYCYNLKKGEDYDKLQPVYLIAFMVEPLQEPELLQEHKKVSWYTMMDAEFKSFAPDVINVIFVRLNEVGSLSECTTAQEKYMYYISHMNSFKDYPEENVGTDFERLFLASEKAKFSKEKMTQYDLELIHELDLKAQIKTATNKGRREGLEEGFKEGLMGAAKALVESGMSIAQVAAILNLSEEELAKVK